jgi:peptidoglycan/xylan/chitin deacetylase (PgdA/CDA1 family)
VKPIAFILAAVAAAIMPAGAVERPPQFVAIAFDNCTELERWQELIEFAAAMNAGGDRLHFTFFMSGSNFLAAEHRNLYQGPGQRRGYSNISFGGSSDDVRRRVEYVNAVRRLGHEIASHAVGHFNGKGWSAEDWTAEFRSYRAIFDNVATHNALPNTVRFDFPFADLVGFRAPYLAVNTGLYTALAAAGFRYDASANSAPNEWPDKRDGLWRFNLARIKVSGLNRTVLSMDYNFLVAHSRGVADPRRSTQFRDQMLQSYLDYFRANYTGNRAPLHIGHHFSGYQNGAYNAALKDFARMVCTLPEVRCVNYTALANFLEGLAPETMAAYRGGGFPRAEAPMFAVTTAASAPEPLADTVLE